MGEILKVEKLISEKKEKMSDSSSLYKWVPVKVQCWMKAVVTSLIDMFHMVVKFSLELCQYMINSKKQEVRRPTTIPPGNINCLKK